MSNVTVAYARLNLDFGPITAVDEPMSTKELQGAYLHAAFLKAMDTFEQIQIEFLPGLVAHRVRFGTEHGDLELFMPESTPARMREIILERLGPTVELPVLKQA
jgi:hypothetical protein